MKFGDKSIKVLGPHIWDQLLRTLRNSYQVNKAQKSTQNCVSQTKQIKVYTETKTSDGTLEFYLIKRLSKNRQNVTNVRLKIVNFKKYNDELNLPRSSNRSKLFEITEEFKEFKLQKMTSRIY